MSITSTLSFVMRSDPVVSVTPLMILPGTSPPAPRTDSGKPPFSPSLSANERSITVMPAPLSSIMSVAAPLTVPVRTMRVPRNSSNGIAPCWASKATVGGGIGGWPGWASATAPTNAAIPAPLSNIVLIANILPLPLDLS